MLLDLSFFFSRELEYALDILDRGYVTKVTTVPSGRYFFQVLSQSYKPRAVAPASAESSIEKPGERYLCWSHYCSCPSFSIAVIAKHDILMVQTFTFLTT